MPSVILIGPPGSGKSSVGKSLAQRLSVSFSDTDTIIENERKKSISDIFIESVSRFSGKLREWSCSID